MGNQHVAGIIMRQLMTDKHENNVVSVFRGMMPVFLPKFFRVNQIGGGGGGEFWCKSYSVRTSVFVRILTLPAGDSRDIHACYCIY
jgi:hypothetical protein